MVGVAAAWTVWTSIGWAGVGIISCLVVLSLLVHIARKQRAAVAVANDSNSGKPAVAQVSAAPAAVATIAPVVAPAPGDQGETVLLKPEDFVKSEPAKPAKPADADGGTVVLTPAGVVKTPELKAAPKVAKVMPVKVAPAPVKPKVAPAPVKPKVAPAPVKPKVAAKPTAPKADPGYSDTSSLGGPLL